MTAKTRLCADNERMKHRYLAFLEGPKRRSTLSVDQAAAAIDAYQAFHDFRPFKSFRPEHATALRRHLEKATNPRTGKPHSRSSLCSTLRHLKEFFFWLAGQPGYKSQIDYSDCEHFNPSLNDQRIAQATRPRKAPTIAQVEKVLSALPSGTDIEKRDRAMIAFALIACPRSSALISLKLRDVDLAEGAVFQDARHVRTKFRKSFTTYFFPTSPPAERIFREWVTYLRDEKLFGLDDPLFPKPLTGLAKTGKLGVTGISREHWSGTGPVNRIFREAFEAAGLPYFHPHAFRNTVALFGEDRCITQADWQAWAQNMGHESPTVTSRSYAKLSEHQQGALVRKIGQEPDAAELDPNVVRQILKIMRETDTGDGADAEA